MSEKTPSTSPAGSTSAERVDAGRDAFVAGSIGTVRTGAEYHAPVRYEESSQTQSQSQTVQVQLQMPASDPGAAPGGTVSRYGGRVAVAGLVALAAGTSLLALPAPVADFEFWLTVDGLSLELAETSEPIADLRLAVVAAPDLGAVELPASGSLPARRIAADGELLGVVVTRSTAADPLTLNPQWLAPRSWLHLEYLGTAKSYRLGFESPGLGDGLSIGPSRRPEPVLVNFRGSATLHTARDGARTLHADHGSVGLVPRTNRLVLDLDFSQLPSLGAEKKLPISDLDLSRVEELSRDGEPAFRRLSTLLAGKVRTAAGVHEVEPRELLRWSGLRDGFVSIQFFDNYLQIDGKGRMAGLTSTTPGGDRQSLMPSRWSAWWSTSNP